MDLEKACIFLKESENRGGGRSARREDRTDSAVE